MGFFGGKKPKQDAELAELQRERLRLENEAAKRETAALAEQKKKSEEEIAKEEARAAEEASAKKRGLRGARSLLGTSRDTRIGFGSTL